MKLISSCLKQTLPLTLGLVTSTGAITQEEADRAEEALAAEVMAVAETCVIQEAQPAQGRDHTRRREARNAAQTMMTNSNAKETKAQRDGWMRHPSAAATKEKLKAHWPTKKD